MEYKNLLIYIYFWKIKKNIIYKAKFQLFLMSMACKYIIIMKWKQSWESYFTQKPEITEKNKIQWKKLKRLSRSCDRGFRFATKSQARPLKLCLISKNPVNMANHYKFLVRSSLVINIFQAKR